MLFAMFNGMTLYIFFRLYYTTSCYSILYDSFHVISYVSIVYYVNMYYICFSYMSSVLVMLALLEHLLHDVTPIGVHPLGDPVRACTFQSIVRILFGNILCVPICFLFLKCFTRYPLFMI